MAPRFVSTLLLLVSLVLGSAAGIASAQSGGVSRNIIIAFDETAYSLRNRTCSPTGQYRNAQVTLDPQRGASITEDLRTSEVIDFIDQAGEMQTACAFGLQIDFRRIVNHDLLVGDDTVLEFNPENIASNQTLLVILDSDGYVSDHLLLTRVAREMMDGKETPALAETSSVEDASRSSGSERTQTPTPTPTPRFDSFPQGGPIDGDMYLLVGVVELYDTGVEFANGECSGTGWYSDFHDNRQIVAKDGEGNILGVGYLQTSNRSVDGEKCVYFFEMEVPESRFYVISIGIGSEGLIFTFDEVADDYNWSIGIWYGQR